MEDYEELDFDTGLTLKEIARLVGWMNEHGHTLDEVVDMLNFISDIDESEIK